MTLRLGAAAILGLFPALAGEWDRGLAAKYLDRRHKEWASFKPAETAHGPCVSCHGGLLYLMARPKLSGAPTAFETGLLSGLRGRMTAAGRGSMFPGMEKEPLASQAASIDAVMAALLLPIGAGQERALERVWSLQIREGGAKGAVPWFDFKLDPWETADSQFFGSALAAAAASRSPDSAKAFRAELESYLAREQAAQPLHNRLVLLWSRRSGSAREQIVAQAFQVQRPDGAWTIEALGPWKKSPRGESGNYATALAIYSLLKSGVPADHPDLAKAINWLESRQDRQGGYWQAHSMNKDYEPGSMPEKFMTDAATSLAVLALTEARP